MSTVPDQQTKSDAAVSRLASFGEAFRVPATFQAYLEFADRCDFKVEYANGHIIAMGRRVLFMGLAKQ
jgi:hypothetical protein